MDVKNGELQNFLYVNDQQKMTLYINVNRVQYELQVHPTEKLTDLLREKMFLIGTKVSCGIGRCGACSVLVDGELANACLLMAFQVNGKKITTIEGVATNQLDEVQEAFLQEGGFQCGYCTSGMVIAAKALLNENTSPSECDIKEALAGNLCRCTGYGGIIRAVQCLANKEQ
ncbi:MAG: (2Fe-2S)-binding protein [Bacillus sp. (in: firmicutes)]